MPARTPRLLFYVIKPQQLFFLKTKLASVSLRCKICRFKTANQKFYPQILSAEASFYIYDRPLSDINVGLC